MPLLDHVHPTIGFDQNMQLAAWCRMDEPTHLMQFQHLSRKRPRDRSLSINPTLDCKDPIQPTCITDMFL